MSSESVCRLCGSQASNVVKVFTDEPKTRTVVGEMMLDCLFTTVEPDEGYPEEVCQFCHLQLNVFFEFKKKVMEQHKKFKSLLTIRPKAAKRPTPPPAKVTTIEKTYLPIKQEQTHTVSDKNYKQEATTLRIEFKQENSTDANDSDENLLEILESSKPDHTENDVDALSIEYDSNSEAPEAKQEEEQDEDVELIAEEYNAIEANEYEEEHLDDDPPIEYAYETQAFENEFFKSLQADTPKPAKKHKPTKKLNLRNPEPEEGDAYDEVEFIDDDESLENEEDTAYDDTLLNTPKKTTTIVGNQRKIAYQCRQCLKVFPTLAKFLQHVKAHRAKEKCKECNVMVFGEYMSKHMTKHSEIKPFKCKLCGKGFSTQVMCASHEYRHSNVRPFKCKLCEKSFKLGCDLRIHMNCHNDVRKYACEICSKTFRMHSHLANHRETHATENTLECEVCGLMFKTTVTLKSHMRQIHTQDHAYKCKVCNRGFYRKNKLQRHEQSHLRKMKKLTGALKKEERIIDGAIDDMDVIDDMEAIHDMEAIDDMDAIDDMEIIDELEFVEDEDKQVAVSPT